MKSSTRCSSIRISGIEVGADILTRPVAPCSMGDCGGQCCRFGAIVDDGELERIEAQLPRLLPRLRPAARATILRHHWHFRQDVRERYADPGKRYRATRVAEGLCVFVLDQHRGGCALHQLALEDGVSVHLYKPRECMLFPLNDVVRGHLHLHRWPGYPCTAEAPRQSPAYQALEAELRLLLGDGGYEELVARARHLEHLEIELEAPACADPAPVPRGRPPRSRAGGTGRPPNNR